MDTAGDNVQHQDVGGDVRRRRSRRTAARSLVAIVGLVILPLVSVPALATTTTLPGAGTGTGAGPGGVDGPQPSPTQPPVYSDPVPAPAPGPGGRLEPGPDARPPPRRPAVPRPRRRSSTRGDITTALARFAGRATPGHQVRVAEPAVPSASVCRATATPGGTWSCVGTVRSGPAQVFTVLDTTASALPNADAAPSDVIVPPTIDARRPTTGTVTGTGHPGATVTVARAGSSAALTAVVTAAGTWSARWGTGPGAPAEGSVSVNATQTASTATGYRSDLRSAASAARTLVVDRTAPAAPRITAPAGSAAGSAQRVRIAGTAEPRNVVTAYVDSTAVCRASVAGDGSWSCRAADSLRAGSHVARAVAQDEAGNTSSAATAVVFRVSRGASVAPAASSPRHHPRQRRRRWRRRARRRSPRQRHRSGPRIGLRYDPWVRHRHARNRVE
ncbi:Ig-like domain-containing protein [Curtobacterium sp. MCPF17_052]|uniref:Ig-like domain-containing protein n=1 Tax=Curtobacterium sp. MCPF17_052 TaxID=2175655 RepID=UPI0024E02B35|nr:Ig-like domain-containing protein [Curtobacterium sp. MCPF17_052]WIB11992.1 Ig-like domain-containing protein [Curtobacterium sp. MCPF17_052]